MLKKLLKGKTDSYVEKHGLIGNADDYHIYHMRILDYLVGFSLGFVLGFVVTMVFFRIFTISVIAGIICGIPAIRFYQKYRKEKRQKDLLIEPELFTTVDFA